MFKKVLIANRGEIALRIHRACKEMGIETVVVHSTADANSMAVRLADESVCIGSNYAKDSYLNIQAILSAALLTNADAIHPGYGFLSENADFVRMSEEHGFTFIGPKAEHIDTMGDKVMAKKTVIDLGIPVVPGSDGAVEDMESGRKDAVEMGFPVIIKAASGGGGRGMKVVEREEDYAEAYSTARSEAKANFGDDTVYMEKFLQKPRHIEIQVFGDKHGNAVHLGERDCSIQRRHQKVIEEAPSPCLSEDEREAIGSLTAKAVRDMGYVGAGTVEYLYEDGKFYFMEMNTRIQVEHPVTEQRCGIDLIAEQIKVAMDIKLDIKQEKITFKGHVIECRINAEDPKTSMPSPGLITHYHRPGGMGIRVDDFIYTGYNIPPHYDSMISKVIIYADTRAECINRALRALDETVVGGIKTNIDLHKEILSHSDFRENSYNTNFLAEKC